MKSAILVDSVASLSQELLDNEDIYVVDLKVQFDDGSTFRDVPEGAEMAAFYEKLQAEAEPPKTSQPSPGEYVAVLDEIVAKGYDVLYVLHMSSKLSGTYQSAKLLLEDYADKLDIHLIDSKTVSVIIEANVLQLIELIKAGGDPAENAEKIQWVADNSIIYVLIDDYDNLIKGGRASNFSAFLGSLLGIVPVIAIDGSGELVVYKKIRTMKRAKNELIKLADDYVKKYGENSYIVFAHGNDEAAALELQARIKELYPDKADRIAYLSPVLGTHGGQGALGMGLIPSLKDR